MYCIACICTIWSKLKRGKEVELVDLTRGMRKNVFFRARFFFSHCSHETQTSPALQKKIRLQNFFSELEKLFFCRALFQLSFLAILAIFVVDCLIFGKAAKDCIAQSAARWGKASGSRVRCRGSSFHQVIGQTMFQARLEAVQACAEKQFFGAWTIDFLQNLSFLKVIILGKTMFQVPTSIHILILRGLEAVQARACKARFHPIRP